MSAAPEPGQEISRGHGGKIATFAAFVVVIVAFFALDGQSYLTLEAVKANRDELLAVAEAHFVLALALPWVASLPVQVVARHPRLAREARRDDHEVRARQKFAMPQLFAADLSCSVGQLP